MILMINGLPRKGKTLLLTLFALLAADSGRKVYCNYFIEHKNCELVDVFDLVDFMRAGEKNPLNSPLYNAVLVATELYGWIESRTSSSFANVFFTDFLFQSGKLGFDVFADAQLVSTVDVRFRELCELRFEATKGEGGFVYYVLDSRFKNQNVRSGRSFTLPFGVASTWWNRYRSYEVKNPLKLNMMVAELLKLDPLRANDFINAQVKRLFELGYSFSDCSRVGVQSALLEIGEPDVFASVVAVRLKRRLNTKR